MIRFSDEQLAAFAAWESVVDGFGRDNSLAERTVSTIRSALERLPADVLVTADGGLSNYFCCIVAAHGEITAARRVAEHRNLAGVAVLLSLLGPYAVVAHAAFSVSARGWGWSFLEPEQVEVLGVTGLDAGVVGVVRDHGYAILDRETILQKLPAGIVPYEYCLCSKPWDRVFHVLFSDTD